MSNENFYWCESPPVYKDDNENTVVFVSRWVGGFYCGRIYDKKNKDICSSVCESDKDLFLLKCAAKANDLGWNIKFGSSFFNFLY